MLVESHKLRISVKLIYFFGEGDMVKRTIGPLTVIIIPEFFQDDHSKQRMHINLVLIPPNQRILCRHPNQLVASNPPFEESGCVALYR